MFISEAT